MIKIGRNGYATIRTMILTLLIGLSISGCKDGIRTNGGWTPESTTDKIETEEGWMAVSMNFDAAELLNPAKDLRALTPAEENGIKEQSVRVLVFKNTGTGTVFDHEAKVTKIEPDASKDNAEGKITLLIKDSAPASYKFVVLVNVSLETPAVSNFSGKSAEEVLALFTFKMPNENTWNGNELPMWGELSAVAIHSQGAVPSLGTVSLVRAVARIDVGLNVQGTKFSESAQGITGFSLTSAHFYNMNNQGYVAPTSSNYSSTEKKVTAPSVPASGVSTIDFDKNSEIKNNLLLRSVYVPEAANANDASTNYLRRPCMVVGIKGAVKGNADKPTYYRIDFLKRTGTEPTATYEYLPLLRNYRYLVNITKVGGPGFDSPEEAKKGPAANIMYNVETWEESSMSNVQYDGQYMLGVSDDQLTYYNRKSSQSITIRTSWPDGWTAAVTSPDSDWLSIDNESGESGADVSLGISVEDNTAENATEREGVITIKAGRMSWKVKVKQLNVSKLSIKITGHKDQGDAGEEIALRQFSGKKGSKKITIEYSPVDAKLEGPNDLKLENDFVFEKVEGESYEGHVVYRINVNNLADEANLFESITDATYFTIETNGQTSAASMALIQTEYNAIPYKDKNLVWNMIVKKDELGHQTGEEAFYLLDGNESEFYIQSNTPYQITMIKNDPNVKLITDGFELNKTINKKGKYTGEAFTFRTTNDISNPSIYLGFAEFKITSPDDLFEPKTFKIALGSGIKQEEANSYMLMPSKLGVLIPVSRINTASGFYDDNIKDIKSWEQYSLPTLGLNQHWMPELIWSDMETVGTKPINNDGSSGIRAIYKWNEGSEGYLFVLPGKDKTGNALVACKDDNGTTLWSWHIWVLNEYPKTIDKWQDRNLGAIKVATSSTDENPETYGMQYQFGRKDPFPLTSAIDTEHGYRSLVDAEGNSYALKQVNSMGTMRKTIQAPTTIIYRGNNWMEEAGDFVSRRKIIWYAVWGGTEYNQKDRNIKLSTSKTVFDPCPYGWKVPAFGVESNWDKTTGIVLPKAGTYYDGNLGDYSWEGSKVLYGLSTVRSNDPAARYIYYSGNNIYINNGTYNRAMGRVIRCVKNDSEPNTQIYLP